MCCLCIDWRFIAFEAGKRRKQNKNEVIKLCLITFRFLVGENNLNIKYGWSSLVPPDDPRHLSLPFQFELNSEKGSAIEVVRVPVSLLERQCNYDTIDVVKYGYGWT